MRQRGVEGWHIRLVKKDTKSKIYDDNNNKQLSVMPDNLKISTIPVSADMWFSIFRAAGFSDHLLQSAKAKTMLENWVDQKYTVENLIIALSIIEGRGDLEKPIAYYAPLMEEVVKKNLRVSKEIKKDANLTKLLNERSEIILALKQFSEQYELLLKDQANYDTGSSLILKNLKNYLEQLKQNYIQKTQEIQNYKQNLMPHSPSAKILMATEFG